MAKLSGCALALILAAGALGQPQTSLRVNAQRIGDHLRALSKFGPNPQGGVSRVAYSEADLQGRAYAMTLMKDAGLTVHIDDAGNIVGSRPGSDPALKPLLIGSHIDSVPMGGNYDGDVGSLSAIEVAQLLKEKQVALRHPLEVIIFENEEGGTIGSQALGEGLGKAQLDLIASSGKTVRDGIRLLGGNPDRLAAASFRPAASPATSNCTSNKAASWSAKKSISALSKASSEFCTPKSPSKALPTTPAPRPWISAMTLCLPPPASSKR